MKKIVLLCLGACLSISAIRAQDSGFKKLPNGVSYKIFTPNTGLKPQLRDLMIFNFTQKTDKDSLLLSSYQSGQPVQIPLMPTQDIRDLMYLFPLLGEKDSALVKIPTDSIFAGHEDVRPAFLPKGGFLHFTVKMEKVTPMAELSARYQKFMDSVVKAERPAMLKYLADSQMAFDSTASGLRYKVLHPTTGLKVAKGDSVWVNYTGRLINGKVFDSSVETEAKAAGLSQPGREYQPISVVVGEGRVIRGWDEGLQLLTAGSKARFVIPSALAYGEQGGGSEIPPYAPLVFDVEVVKVVKVKKVMPVSKTAPAKKPLAKKPLVKKSTTPVKKTGTAVKK